MHTQKHLVYDELHRDLERYFENSKVLNVNINSNTIEMKGNKLIALADYYSFSYNIEQRKVNASYFSMSYLSFNIPSPSSAYINNRCNSPFIKMLSMALTSLVLKLIKSL